MIQEISPERDDWLSSVDGRRDVFFKVTQRVEEALKIEISGEVAYEARDAATHNVGLAGGQAPQASSGREYDAAPVPSGHERFLDAEIIAIYW